MQRAIIGSFVAIMLATASAGPASAGPGDPLPSPLSGFVPPTQGGLSCTRYMNKRATVMPVKCRLKCATKFASAAARGLTNEDNNYCDNTWYFSCQEQYSRALDKLDQGTCMNCLDGPARVGLYSTYSDVVNTAKDQIYCDSNPNNTPFYDGHGFVSQQRDVVKCQNGVMRALSKAAKCLNLHCHQKTAETLFWDKPVRITDAQCEDQDAVKSCKAHYDVSISKLSGCPPCVDFAAVWTSFQQGLDTNNGDIYCSDS
jgi:hypothetical protein